MGGRGCCLRPAKTGGGTVGGPLELPEFALAGRASAVEIAHFAERREQALTAQPQGLAQTAPFVEDQHSQPALLVLVGSECAPLGRRHARIHQGKRSRGSSVTRLDVVAIRSGQKREASEPSEAGGEGAFVLTCELRLEVTGRAAHHLVP